MPAETTDGTSTEARTELGPSGQTRKWTRRGRWRSVQRLPRADQRH